MVSSVAVVKASPSGSSSSMIMEDDTNSTTGGGGLIWQNLSSSTKDSTIVHRFSGWVENGQICGILGPSGAGKTTFLLAIGEMSSPSLEISGTIQHDGKEIDSQHVAWLQQQDAFFDALTVEETLHLAVYLELPQLSLSDRKQIVQTNLNALGLDKLSARQIGQKLSGGERRRLSIAQELVTTTQIFLADEPTSGLDSFLGEKVVKLIKSLAEERNIPCLCSLHQPRSSIWKLLDMIILVAPHGRVCYVGRREDAVPYFDALGYPCPRETNPAEFLVDLVSIDTEDVDQAIQDQLRIQKLSQAFEEYNEKLMSNTPLQQQTSGNQLMSQQQAAESFLQRGRSPLRFIRRFGALFQRSWRQNFRSHYITIIRLVASIGSALLFAQIFPNIPPGCSPSPSDIADRVALLSFGVINMCMLAFMKTIDMFSREKAVIQREQRRNQYSALEYLFCKAVAELPLEGFFSAVYTTVLKYSTGIRISWTDLNTTISLMTILGASLGFAISGFAPTREAGMSAGVPIIVVLLVVGVINPSGVNTSNPPSPLVEFLRYFSPIGAAVRALCLAEFRDMEFVEENTGRFPRFGLRKFRNLPKMGALALVQNGNQVLEELGLKDATFQGILKHMIKLTFVNLGISYAGLVLSKNQFFLRGSWLSKLFRRNSEDDDVAPLLKVDVTREEKEEQQHAAAGSGSTSSPSSSKDPTYTTSVPTTKVKI